MFLRWRQPRAPEGPFRLNQESPQAAGLVMWAPIRISQRTDFVRDVLGTGYYGTGNNGGVTAEGIIWTTDPEMPAALFTSNTGWFVSVSYSPISLSGSSMTLAAWVRPAFANGTGSNAFAKIICQPATNTGADPFIIYAVGTDNSSPARFVADISTGTAGTQRTATGTTTLVASALYHVAATYDGAALRLYVNGQLEASTATTIAIGDTNKTTNLFIQGTSNNANNIWRGTLLDARIYRVAKEAAEVHQMYAPDTRWDLYLPARRLIGTSSVPSAAVTMTAYVQLIVSSVSVANAVGLRPLAVSAEWVVSGGTSPFAFQWLANDPTASATTSAFTRTYSAGSGAPYNTLVSARVSDASGTTVASSFLVQLRFVRSPNPFDGRFVVESQKTRRLWPM